MSASREKKLRQDLAAQGITDPKLIREAEERAKARKTNTLYGIIAAVFVVVAAVVLVYNSGVLQRGKTAVVIDGEKYTAAQVNYYYMSRKNSILNSGYATYYGLDGSKSMDSQIVSDTAKMLLQITDESEMTWDEYLRNDAIRTLTIRTRAAKLAEENGMGADEHTQEEINATMDEVAAYAKQNGYSTKEYLKLVFGSTMTVSTFKQMAELDDVSSHYMQHYQEDLTYTDSDLESYYAANKDSFDVAAYEYIYFKGTADSTTDSEGNKVDLDDAAIEANRAEAEAHAQEILDALVAGDKDKAAELAETYGATDDSNLAGIENSGYADWMNDASHQTGSYGLDENISASDNETLLGYFAIYVNDRYLDDYNGVNVRVIRDAGTAGDDGTYDMSNPLSDQEAILQKYDDGDKTAEAFGALADEYSQDSSTYTGGLRENVSKKAYNAEITAWLFDDARVEGDVKGFTDEDTHNCYTFYYVGRSDTPYWKTVCITNVQNDKYGDWLDEVTANYPTENGTAMRFVG